MCTNPNQGKLAKEVEIQANNLFPKINGTTVGILLTVQRRQYTVQLRLDKEAG